MKRPGIGDGDENGGGFDEKIRALVVAALGGKDVEEATPLTERSIDEARSSLEREEASICEMLGSMDGAEYVGPCAPILPPIERSMTPGEFTLGALRLLGAPRIMRPGALDGRTR